MIQLTNDAPLKLPSSSSQMTLLGAHGRINLRLETVLSLTRLEQEWKDLDRSGTHTFFVSWPWIGAWLATLPDLSQVRVLRAYRDDVLAGLSLLHLRTDALGGILPIRRAYFNSAGAPAIDRITIEHNGFAGSDIDDVALSILLRSVGSSQLPVDELILPCLATSLKKIGETDAQIIATRRETGYSARLKSTLQQGSAFPDWPSANTRQKLRRSAAHFGGQDSLNLSSAQTTMEKLLYFREMVELHNASWAARGKRSAFAEPCVMAFAETLISDERNSDCVDMLRGAAGGQLLGYLMNFRWRGIVYNYQSGLNYALRDYQPGYLSHLLAMRYYAEIGCHQYDFLAGPNQMKKSLANATYCLESANILKPSGTSMVLQVARYLRSFIKP